jgi:hypothetical protein
MRRAMVVTAGITFTQIVELLVLFLVLNAILLAPLIPAIIGVVAEYQQNRRDRDGREL